MDAFLLKVIYPTQLILISSIKERINIVPEYLFTVRPPHNLQTYYLTNTQKKISYWPSKNLTGYPQIHIGFARLYCTGLRRETERNGNGSFVRVPVWTRLFCTGQVKMLAMKEI